MLGKLFLCILPLAFGQIPIPKRPLGFVYNMGSPSAPVDFDVYMGPLCPDSAAVLPTIVKVADHYGPSKLMLRIHLFPLPYHTNSFTVAMGTHAVDQLTKKNMTYTWMQKVYTNLQSLSDVSVTESQIVVKMAGLAKSMGIMETDFTRLATNQDINEDCRIAWKYAASRSVTGTPTFMINDVVVSPGAMWTETDWYKVIDPLMRESRALGTTETCKVGTKKCTYLPGKIECCTKGENCIPNVGCRC